MRLKNLFYIVCLSFFVLISCSKDDLVENVEGKIIYSQAATGSNGPYYIRDLKTNSVRGFNSYPIVSHMGDKVAMHVDGQGYYRVVVTDFSGEQELYEYDVPSFSITDLVWSPGDNQLAMLSNEKKNIKVFDFTTRKITEIFLPGSEVFKKFIKWSEKDNIIYFMSQNNRNEISIGKIKPDGSGYQTVFKPQSHHIIGRSFYYHEGSDLILFTYFDSINSLAKICKIGTNGSDFKFLYSDFAMHADWITNINISTDGKKILYQYGFLDDTYIMDINGLDNKLLWHLAANPQWSKEGTAVMANVRYYADWNTSKWEIRIKSLDQDDGDAQTVIKGPVIFYSWYFD